MYHAFGSLEREIQFLELKLLELNRNYSSENKGFDLLYNRINELKYVFEKYQKLIENFNDDSIEVEYEDTSLDLVEEDIRNIDIEIDPEIKKVEDEVIDFFLYNSAYSGLDELTNQVYVYFFTRKILTQKKIRYLTGLSLGKVSQILKFMIDLQMIEKLDKKRYKIIIPDEMMRQQFYSMISIQSCFFKSALESGKMMLLYEKKFENYRKELSDKEELKFLNGYENILEMIESYLKLFSITKKVEDLYKKFF